MSKVAAVADVLYTVFGELPDQVNQSVRVVRRQRKFSPRSLAAAFILAFLKNPQAKDKDIADMAVSLDIDVSPQAVDQRFTPQLTDFFRVLFEKMAAHAIGGQQKLAPLLDRFTEVRLIDSTGFGLPEAMASEFPGCGGSGRTGGNAAAIKFQTELDLRSGALCCVQAEPGKLPDQATNRQQVMPKPGGLRIGDLGYFSLKVFKQIDAAQAYFLSRLQFQTRMVDDAGQLIELIAFLRSTTKNTAIIDRIVVLGRDARLRCRLIAWRVPEDVARQRRKKLRATHRKRGKTPSRKSLLACNWNYLVTNLTAEQLSIEEAIVLYRSRWQIELLFKRWKSYCDIELLDGRSLEQTKCRFWIRMCAALLQHYLVVGSCWSEVRVPSFAKVAKCLGTHADELAGALAVRKRIESLIKKISRKARISCKRTQRKKKPGWIELIRDPTILEYALT